MYAFTNGGFWRKAAVGKLDMSYAVWLMTAASRYPEDVLRFTQVRQRGGLRARVLTWVLGDAAIHPSHKFLA